MQVKFLIACVAEVRKWQLSDARFVVLIGSFGWWVWEVIASKTKVAKQVGFHKRFEIFL